MRPKWMTSFNIRYLYKMMCYISQGRGYAIRLVCMSFFLSFCLVCVQDYCKSDYAISLKLGVVIGPTSRKNWVTFGGDPIPDTDSRSFFGFQHHCEIGDFRRFITTSHTVTGWFSQHSVKWLMLTSEWIHNVLGPIRQTSASEFGLRLIWQSEFESWTIFGWG